MPIYRYKLSRVNIDKLKKQVPPADASSVTSSASGAEVIWDVNAPATSKDDIDSYLATLGWEYVEQDPSDTPAQSSAEDIPAGSLDASNISHGDLGGVTENQHHNRQHGIGSGSDHTSATLAQLNALVSDATLDDSGDPRDPNAHAIGGAEHSVSTLAQFNAKISDATLDDSGDPRDPNSHAFAGAEHSGSTLAQVNAKISDANLDDSGDPRDPNAHAIAGPEHSASTLAQFNAKISDATLDDSGDPRDPNAHAFAGAEHSASTLAQVNSKISDATLIDTTDSRLSDARTPTSHASTHKGDGADAIAVATQTVAGLESAADKTKLDGIASGATNTPLTNSAPVNVTKAAAAVGTSGEAARQDHKHDVSTAAPGTVTFNTAAEGSATSLARSDHRHALTSPSAPVNVTKAAASAGSSANVARQDHKHDITTATAGAVTPGSTAAEGTATSLARSDHRHSLPAFGTGSGTFCQGNDSRLSDARTPTAHASTHRSGGSDSIKLDDLAAPDDNTDLNATTSAHGLLPKLGGGSTNYLRADGTWAAPPGGGGDVTAASNLTDTAVVVGDGGAKGVKTTGVKINSSGYMGVDQTPDANIALKTSGIAFPDFGVNVGSTTTYNNYAVGVSSNFNFHSANQDYEITGLSDAVAGKLVIIHNTTDYNCTIRHENAGSSTNNRFDLPNDTDIKLPPNGAITVTYGVQGGGSKWRVISGFSGGPLVKLFQAIDTVGGLTVTNVAQPIDLNFESIKDDYYSHSTLVNPSEITILEEGWYRVVASTTVASVSSSGGIRGNPQLHIDIDTGSGFVQQPDNMGGYIREDSSASLSTSITGVGLLHFNANDKMRITVVDSVAIEPDEETVAYSSRVVLEYIDRTGAASGVVNNLKDVGDVEANAPTDNDGIYFNGTTSKWEAKPAPSSVRTYDAIVDAAGNGDYLLVSEAVAAGANSIYVRTGFYVETSTIMLPTDGIIIQGEGGSVIQFVGASGFFLDGNLGAKETAGTISVSTDSTTVTGVGTTFTNLATGDYIKLGASRLRIASVTSDTSLELSNAWRGDDLTNKNYIATDVTAGSAFYLLNIAGSAADILRIRAGQGISIRDCVLRGSTAGVGIRLEDCYGGHIEETFIVSNSGGGIAITDSYEIVMEGSCHCDNNDGDGILINGDSGHITIANSSFTNNDGDGLSVEGTAHDVIVSACMSEYNNVKGVNTESDCDAVTITACVIEHNGDWGIDWDGSHNVIKGCTIEENVTGGVQGGDVGILDSNHISENTGPGINLLLGDDNNIISNNRIQGNTGTGIVVDGDDNIFLGNLIDDNGGNGINISASGSGNRFSNNRIQNNIALNFVDNGTNNQSTDYRTYVFQADMFECPINSDWAVNSLSPVATDPNNAGLIVRPFDDTTEEGIGFTLLVPNNANNITLQLLSRAATAPGSAQTVALTLYERDLGDNAPVGSWSSAVQLTDIDIPTNAYYQKDEQTFALSTIGLTPGKFHQLELTRDTADAGDTLSGDWLLRALVVRWS